MLPPTRDFKSGDGGGGGLAILERTGSQVPLTKLLIIMCDDFNARCGTLDRGSGEGWME